MMSLSAKQRGFTLIELLIAITIITILGLLAYPSYTNKVGDARRAMAQADLVQLLQFANQYFTESNSYTGLTLPFSRSPRSGDAHYYDLSFRNGPTASSFTLQATVVSNNQSGCNAATLTLTHDGTKGAVKSGGLAVSGCW